MGFAAELAIEASRAALRLRRTQGIGLWDSLCPIDLAERLGLEVWFTDIPGMEGMYWRNQQKLFISAHRPPGRQAFTASHELAHHVFGHGTRIDKLLDEKNRYPVARAQETHEALADLFAGFLLMPKAAVERGFHERGFPLAHCTAEQVYEVAQWLGVGFQTLATHMACTLRVIDRARLNDLAKTRVSGIKARLEVGQTAHDYFFVDQTWRGRPVDMQVGDRLVAPPGSHAEGKCLEEIRSIDSRQVYFQAARPGVGRCVHAEANWAAFVRVSRRKFVGRNIFRFLEEA